MSAAIGDLCWLDNGKARIYEVHHQFKGPDGADFSVIFHRTAKPTSWTNQLELRLVMTSRLTLASVGGGRQPVEGEFCIINQSTTIYEVIAIFEVADVKMAYLIQPDASENWSGKKKTVPLAECFHVLPNLQNADFVEQS